MKGDRPLEPAERKAEGCSKEWTMVANIRIEKADRPIIEQMNCDVKALSGYEGKPFRGKGSCCGPSSGALQQ